ncbi:MAG: hypothetical protein IKW08_04550 [Roseburia sp.]|nr:hypothetical protein [Roseburia sp.]
MRIEQQNNILEMLQQNTNVDGKGSNGLFAEKAKVAKSKYSDNQSVLIKDSTYLNPALEDRDELTDVLKGSTALDATDRKNQMAVLSHTTSEEDFAKMQEEGFSLNETTGNTIVTVTDKIKLQIAKGGGDVSCFGDDLSKAQLEELTGSTALAQHLEQKLKASDLPATGENVAACELAYKQAESVGPLTDGSIKYLLDNQLAPTIENFYKAAHVGGGCYTTSGNDVNIKSMQTQIMGIIKGAGIEVNEQAVSDSKWLIANGIALTTDNLSYLSDLRNYNGELAEEELTDAIMTALMEGKAPTDALLLSGYDYFSRAKDAFSVINNATDADIRFIVDNGLELTIKNLKSAAGDYEASQDTNPKQKDDYAVVDREMRLLTAHRQLEEARLVMTVEANYSLLKRGMSIDTKPLVELVEALKKEESQYYASLLESQGMEVTEEKVSVFAETQEKLSAIKSVPAYVLGMSQAEVDNIKGVYVNGMALKAAMEKANQSYEPLMTAPRSDLGDSYSKAFQNVDDILRDLDLGLTEANRRAVRILAYNQLEITADAVLKMKAADKEVQRAFKNLTPRVVMEMLHKGENPLDMDFGMLNKRAEMLKQELNSDDTERFSEFLWKMEQNKAITEEERSSFIGVYRLLHQVEQTDGAAIGAVLNQGADLTLKNLLTAVRSANKQKKMDITVDDSFGEKEKSNGYTNSITDQIMAGYQNNCVSEAKEALTPGRLVTLEKQGTNWMEMTPEQLAEVLQQVDAEDTGVLQEYAREQLNGFRQCANTSAEVYQMLEQYDIPNSVQNILAMEAMMSDRNQLFKQILGDRNQQDNDSLVEDGILPQEEIASIKQQLIEDFGKAVTEPKEMAEAQEALGKLAENVMKTMIESDEVTYIDIKEAKLLRAQLSIQKKMSQKETYSVPVLVGDEVTNVTLKIVRGVEKRGMVDILLESQLSGKIAATFQAKEKGISGMIATDNPDTKDDMLKRLDQFAKALQGEDIESADIKVAYITDLDLNHFSNTPVSKDSADVAGKTEASADTDAYQIQTTRLYGLAEAFIRVVKEIYK